MPVCLAAGTTVIAAVPVVPVVPLLCGFGAAGREDAPREPATASEGSTTLQRPGCSPGDGDGGRAVPEPVLSPAVVANQPTLTVEMSASAIPAPSCLFTVLPTLQHLTREKEARRKALNPSTFPCPVSCSSDTSSSSSRLDRETRCPSRTRGRRAAHSTPSSDRLLSCLLPEGRLASWDPRWERSEQRVVGSGQGVAGREWWAEGR
ncbi:PREDICTED: uncharacterized protein LOC108448388 [Corvus brachyrhynchos]|uniref:uncharacterized protein LOC108448388 n=1 Tax=Corvus brachyrhynchos TaxID=85066 RepID=UPI0005351045|nr:PREDICTED: uncharacterized protein LOC108448388 [Corvus brachyrhynchos]